MTSGVGNVDRQEQAEACTSADATEERHQESLTFDDLMRKGNACLQVEDFEQAIVHYERARQLQPYSLAVHLTLYLALIHLDRGDEAADVIKAAMGMDDECCDHSPSPLSSSV